MEEAEERHQVEIKVSWVGSGDDSVSVRYFSPAKHLQDTGRHWTPVHCCKVTHSPPGLSLPPGVQAESKTSPV